MNENLNYLINQNLLIFSNFETAIFEPNMTKLE